MKLGSKCIQLTGAAVTSVASSEMPIRKLPIISSNRQVTHVEMGKLIPGMSTVSTSCLKAAASEYHISPNIADYNFALIPILVTGMPNVNMQAVPTRELLRFLPDHGCQSYKTYLGKCLFQEHKNDDPTKSLGIVLDASLIPVKKYNIARLMILAAYDRTKSARAAKDCLNPNTSYSMGCASLALQCSICGGIQGPAVQRTCTCYDCNYTDIAAYGKVKGGVLHYMMAQAPVFFEASIVRVPAEFSCQGEGI